MDTKNLLESYIKEKTKKYNDLPEVITKGMEIITGQVPEKLKLAVVLSELITFCSHLRKSAELGDGTKVPSNAFVFALSASGTAKDRSVNACRAALSSAYEHLETMRIQHAEEVARIKDPIDWKEHYKKPCELHTGLGTVEGLVRHFKEISRGLLGAGYVMSSEIGTELQTNPDITNIIKMLSISYDLGNVPAKVLKDTKSQIGKINNLPVNLMFFGSQEAILYDKSIKDKFKNVFNTQLARRSMFFFTPDPILPKEYKSIDSLYEDKEKERNRAKEAVRYIDRLFTDIAKRTTQQPLKLNPDTQKLFDVYLEYNNRIAEEIPNAYPISKLSRKHKQWLALKLATSLSIIYNEPDVSEKCYALAINIIEYFSSDLLQFEKELIKNPYELLVSMCNANETEGELFISAHELKKLGYLSGSGAVKPKINDLATMANSCDERGIYEASEEGIYFSKLQKTDSVGVSYIIYESSLKDEKLKEFINKRSSKGYEYYECAFEELEDLLAEKAAFSPFEYENGIRSKETLKHRTGFIVIDIDKSKLTDEEAHILLSDYNHFIVRTSNPNNDSKFRILLQLDSEVVIVPDMWRHFIRALGDELGFIIDTIPQSSMCISYGSDRRVLKQLNGSPIEVKPLMAAASKYSKVKTVETKELPSADKKQKLSNMRDTFSFAFEASNGSKSTKLYAALCKAIALGADKKYVRNLAESVGNYWSPPMDKERLENTLIIPALRRME